MIEGEVGAGMEFTEQDETEYSENCGREMVLKKGRFGEFTSCSSYPTCKYIKQKTIDVKCPNCADGEVVERRSKRGKTFFGCNKYPECDFVAWGKPILEKCPNYKDCKFKRELEPAVAVAAPAVEAVPA